MKKLLPFLYGFVPGKLLRFGPNLLVLAACSFSLVISGFSQETGNQWIDFNQAYFKIKTAKDGMCRITYDGLLAAGFPVGSVDPRKIQLFHRGNEQAIFILGQEDARINPGDYIEFYGQRNDGTSDVPLYEPATAQPHPYYNLYSDTTAYFLTWKLNNETGRRMASFTEANVDGRVPEPFHMEERLQLLTSEYSAGQTYPEGTSQETLSSSFDQGEGWTGPRIRKAQSGDYSFSGLNNRFINSPKPVLEVLLAGRNNRPHNVEVQVGASPASFRTIKNVQFNYYKNLLVNEQIEWTDISASGNLTIRTVVNGFDNDDADFVSVSYLKVSYPQTMDAQNGTKFFHLPTALSGKAYMEIKNAAPGSRLYDITDPANTVNVGTATSGANVTAIVPNTTVPRELLFSAEINPVALERVRFRRIVPASHNYLIITHEKLQSPANGMADPVKAYAAYRASLPGGGYDTLTVNMKQLYDQFSYGETSPLGIKRFAEFMANGGDPRFLFLIGKALGVNYNFYRQQPGTLAFDDLVPTYGYPGSDVPFSSGVSEDGYAPAIPTGRLNARVPEEVLSYLNKVKEMEAKPLDDLSRKNLIHLSGGVTISELSLFKQFVNSFKAVAEGPFLGGDVVTQSKSSNNSVELINISDKVNEGVGLITFYGHSSPTIIDIEIGYASNDALGYRNKGKYPMILVNGCNAGSIFGTTYTFGEDWMITPDRGAVGFIAHSALGYVGPLKRYSDTFYATAYADTAFIHQSIGEIHQEVTRRYMASSSETELNIAQVEQMVLQGDPAVKLFGADKPDYQVSNNALFLQSFDNRPVTALADSFAIGVLVKNFGRTSQDSLGVSVKRTFSDGRVVDYETQYFNPVFYQDTLYFTIRSPNPESFGNNRFDVYVDGDNGIEELNETNNMASLDYFLPMSGISNLLPVNFSIVNETSVDLLVQSTNLLAKNRDYLFEIDTAHHFNSPYKMQAKVNARALAKWNVALLNDNDSLVYYWRTKFADPEPAEDTSWVESSFIFINNGPEGWAQAEFPQFLDNEVAGLDKNSNNRSWSFIQPENRVVVKTFGAEDPENDVNQVELLINGVPYIFSGRLCASNTLNAVAFEQSSAVAYNVLQTRSCGRLPQVINNFTNNDLNTGNLLNQYIEAVPDGDMVLLFSIGSITYETWPAGLRQQLATIGASEAVLNALKTGEPYIVLGRKGAPAGSAIEIVADPASSIPTLQQQLSLDETITGKSSSGTILSPKIGPVAAWDSFYQHHQPTETGEILFDIYGIDFQNRQSLLFSDVNASTLSLLDIDAIQFPYLQLQANLEDTENFNPPQLKRWQVNYTGVPEGVLSLKSNEGEIVTLEKQEGEEFSLGFIFENVSTRDFTDSLLVQYNFFNQQRREAEVDSFNIKPLQAGDSAHFTIPVTTAGREGLNNFNVFVNPNLQPEQYYNNNIIDLIDFMDVKADNTNPVMDVAFDGVYIMDGDIVSPSPLIMVTVKDENKFVLKKDTTDMGLFLKKPCETCLFEKIAFTDPGLRWTAATETTDFNIEYQPENLPDGIYTLRVQAADASGNKSGVQPYSINFEVINDSQITNFYPYPNPFSTSTRFVFTLTGSEIPDQIKIQIMTVTGKVVKEITQNELGPIRIGHNMSDYAWDGKDEFGDQLANGVYLYKVVVLKHGSFLEKRETSADKAFKKGFGKLYLLR